MVSKILLVEDNIVWLQNYRKWLGVEFQFVEARNFTDAMQSFDEHLPDVVILDLGLPEFEPLQRYPVRW